jgi:hypothetical protein
MNLIVPDPPMENPDVLPQPVPTLPVPTEPGWMPQRDPEPTTPPMIDPPPYPSPDAPPMPTMN